MISRKLDILTWLLVLLACLASDAAASDLKLGLMFASQHIDDGFTCDGIERDFEETNPGIYVIYHGFMVGRYENSYSGCQDLEYSNMIGYQFELGSYRDLEFSVTAALTDGYNDFEDGWDEYRAWASINMKWNLFGRVGPKMFYAYNVAAYSIEGEL